VGEKAEISFNYLGQLDQGVGGRGKEMASGRGGGIEPEAGGSRREHVDRDKTGGGVVGASLGMGMEPTAGKPAPAVNHSSGWARGFYPRN